MRVTTSPHCARHVRSRWFRTALVTVVLCIAAVDCDVTHVSAPGIIQPSDLQNPAGAAVLRAGAIAQFANAFSSASVESGLLVDELSVIPVYSAEFPEDRRTVSNSTAYPFATLSASRLNATDAIQALRQYAPSPAWHIAELYAVTAASDIVLSEHLCSGIPVGVLVNGVPTAGSTLTRGQLLAAALTTLDSAASYAANNDSIGSLINVLRARAWVDSGQFASAAAAAQSVPVAFAYTLPFSSATANQTNVLYQFTFQYQAFTVSDREGINGLPFVSANDQRVPAILVPGASSPVYGLATQDSAGAPMTLASGIEAQLDIAEAALAQGNPTAWANTLNALRQSAVPSMAPLSADSTTNASAAFRSAVMFRERAFWLFGTGHRLGDLRRLVRQYGSPSESVYPTGLYEGGPQTYGTALEFLPSGEQYNTAYQACAVTTP
jgi:starch-binding outer membrane protein, SusD/RagB family